MPSPPLGGDEEGTPSPSQEGQDAHPETSSMEGDGDGTGTLNQTDEDAHHLSPASVDDDAMPMGVIEYLDKKEINLANCDYADKDLEALLPIFEESSSLRVLILRKNNLNLEDGTIATALSNSKNLHTLCLGDNEIGLEGAKHLTRLLVTNQPTITTLNLCNCRLGDDGANEIADALAKNKSLKSIELCSNFITQEGGVKLFDALIHNETLTTLNLQNNCIGDVAARHLAQTLVTNRSLRNINIGGCKIGDEGAEYIGQALKQPSTLKRLWIHQNLIGDGGAQALLRGLAENFTLEKLWFNGCLIGPKSYMAILKALEGREKGKVDRGVELKRNWK